VEAAAAGERDGMREIEHYWICDWGPCQKRSEALETGGTRIDHYPTETFPPEGWIEHRYSDRTWSDIIMGEERHWCLHFCTRDHFDMWKQARQEAGLGITDEH